MTTVTFTFPVGSEAGAQIRQLARQLSALAADLPDRHSSGPAIVLTIDNAPSSGFVSAQITAGPEIYQKGPKRA